jgi:hypothetical protein
MPTSPQRTSLSSLCKNRQVQKIALIAMAAWSIGATSFAPEGFDEQFDDSSKKWEEIALQLPAAPQDADLMSFYVGPTARLDFFIDAKSLSVGSDGVVRYTLVSKSKSGAKNVIYEGIRCETSQKKQYAFGRDDGSWGRSRQDKWQPITELVANRQDAALLKDYLCDSGTVAGSASTIVARIKQQRALTPVPDYRQTGH